MCCKCTLSKLKIKRAKEVSTNGVQKRVKVFLCEVVLLRKCLY